MSSKLVTISATLGLLAVNFCSSPIDSVFAQHTTDRILRRASDPVPTDMRRGLRRSAAGNRRRYSVIGNGERPDNPAGFGQIYDGKLKFPPGFTPREEFTKQGKALRWPGSSEQSLRRGALPPLSRRASNPSRANQLPPGKPRGPFMHGGMPLDPSSGETTFRSVKPLVREAMPIEESAEPGTTKSTIGCIESAETGDAEDEAGSVQKLEVVLPTRRGREPGAFGIHETTRRGRAGHQGSTDGTAGGSLPEISRISRRNALCMRSAAFLSHQKKQLTIRMPENTLQTLLGCDYAAWLVKNTGKASALFRRYESSDQKETGYEFSVDSKRKILSVDQVREEVKQFLLDHLLEALEDSASTNVSSDISPRQEDEKRAGEIAPRQRLTIHLNNSWTLYAGLRWRVWLGDWKDNEEQGVLTMHVHLG